MSDRTGSGLRLSLVPSKRLRIAVLCGHGLALLAVIANALPLAIKVGLMVAVLVSAGWLVRRIGRQQAKIHYDEGVGWQITLAGRCDNVDILPSTVMTNYVVFLHYKTATTAPFGSVGRIHTLLVFNDAVAAADYRHLVVKLKTTAIK